MGKRRGRPPAIDREHRPNGRVMPLHVDVASPFAAARRAVLADPMAAAASLNRAKQDAAVAAEDLRRRGISPAPFSVEDGARALASILVDQRVSTALGRYFFWSRRHGSAFQVTEPRYLGGADYAQTYGRWRAGLGGDIAAGAAGMGELTATGIIVPRRNAPSALKDFTAGGAADLSPEPTRSAEEEREHREKVWRRYMAARARLQRLGHATLSLVDDLVIDDRDPWWISPASNRLGEGEARRRSARVMEERRMIGDGLDALADFFGRRNSERAAAPAGTKRRPRPSLEIVFQGGDIDKAALAASVARIKNGAADR